MPSVAIIGTRGYPSYYGGFETAVRKLAPYLADQGWDVTVYGRRGSTRNDDPGHDYRIRTIETSGLQSKSLSTLSYGLTASLSASRHRPDVALVMNVANGFFLPLLQVARIPTLVNVDGIEWERAKWNRLAKAMFHTGARLVGKHGTRMVYDAREIARRWREEFGLEGDYIPYGGDVSPELALEEGLQHRGYVLVVARFVPENTLPEFVAAASTIARTVPVVIVGSSGYGGEIEDKVRQLVVANPNVRWLGHLSDDRRLLALWQHAGVYFHGHSAGGTNPALVQAMATGAPIVARDTPYNREVLGSGGVFVKPDPTSIARGVTELVAQPREMERRGHLNLARAQEMYSWEGVCKAYENALRELVRR